VFDRRRVLNAEVRTFADLNQVPVIQKLAKKSARATLVYGWLLLFLANRTYLVA
jgi:hypothetical protein